MGQEDLVAQYFDQRAAGYLQRSRSGMWRWLRLRERAILFRLLQPKSGQRLLDLGCGAGFYARPLRFDYGLRVAGVDKSAAMVREMGQAGIPAWHLSVEELDPVPSESFDSILAAGVLEFVARPEKMFAHCARILRPRGNLTILVPLGGSAGRVYDWAHRREGCPTFLRAPQEYVRMAESAGFKIENKKLCTPISAAFRMVNAAEA